MPDTPSWFDTARFGMFVHWSHCSQAGIEVSWPLVGGAGAVIPGASPIGVDEYHALARTFDPAPGAPREWARLARQAGMQYAVLTTKHHDGYALFDTKLSDHSTVHSPCGRDLVREYVDAFRAEGLRIGFYFSLIDWHHPDYPAFTDADRPYRWGQWRQPSPEQWERYLAFMLGQVRELLTSYGQVDVFWFDGGWERSRDQWRAADLEALIRELRPGILLNDRLAGGGDYWTPEQFVPAQPPARRWETCMTMNESWGYNPADTAYKSPRDVIHSLCEVASRGGNLLLNVSPMADGALPPEQVERLATVAEWMERNRESIVGTTPGLEPWQFYGTSTRRGDRVYVHCLMRPYDVVTVRGLHVRKVRRVTALATGEDLAFTTRISAMDRLLNPDPVGELHITVPDRLVDPLATVLALDL